MKTAGSSDSEMEIRISNYRIEAGLSWVEENGAGIKWWCRQSGSRKRNEAALAVKRSGTCKRRIIAEGEMN